MLSSSSDADSQPLSARSLRLLRTSDDAAVRGPSPMATTTQPTRLRTAEWPAFQGVISTTSAATSTPTGNVSALPSSATSRRLTAVSPSKASKSPNSEPASPWPLIALAVAALAMVIASSVASVQRRAERDSEQATHTGVVTR